MFCGLAEIWTVRNSVSRFHVPFNKISPFKESMMSMRFSFEPRDIITAWTRMLGTSIWAQLTHLVSLARFIWKSKKPSRFCLNNLLKMGSVKIRCLRKLPQPRLPAHCVFCSQVLNGQHTSFQNEDTWGIGGRVEDRPFGCCSPKLEHLRGTLALAAM